MRHITTIREFETSEKQCRDFILDNNIISPTKGEKAIRDLTRHLSYALVKSGMMGRKFKTHHHHKKVLIFYPHT
jgi:hypothetical protein